MDLQLQSLAGVLEQTDYRLRAGAHASSRLWPTGFRMLDNALSGGFRSGELVLVAGMQGLGKTTFALQILRYVANSGRSGVYFSFEHDPASMVARLVAMEAGMIAGNNAVGLERVRQAFEGTDGKTGTIRERLSDAEGAPQAIEAVASYAERLMLHRSTGSSTSLETIAEVIEAVRDETGRLPFVVIDYLQKVKVTGPPLSEDERVGRAVEGLKDLALDLDLPVMAIVAADSAGVDSGKRMRARNMRGSSALAHEADTLLMLNEKYDAVARHHLVYSVGAADRFKDWTVVSIEKHRGGAYGTDLEFRKRFHQSRFEGHGQQVAEQLVDDRVYVD